MTKASVESISHRIGDLSFAGGWLDCRCLERVLGETPAKLSAAYQEHRRTVGLKVTFVAIGGHGNREWNAWGFGE